MQAHIWLESADKQDLAFAMYVDENCKIDLSEILYMMAKRTGDINLEKDFLEAFIGFDKDGNGFIKGRVQSF